MGIEHTITFASGDGPSWEAVRDLLAAHGFPASVKMIDGELAFPDEIPPAEWRELRLGTSQGMITLRRQPGRLTTVTWGNAERLLAQAWNAVTWACAEAGSGKVLSEKGPLSAGDYRRAADLPESLR